MAQKKNLVDEIKDQWDENPLAVVAAGVVVFGAFTKFIDTVGAFQGRRAYARAVDARLKKKGM